jgi:hypothetical protein
MIIPNETFQQNFCLENRHSFPPKHASFVGTPFLRPKEVPLGGIRDFPTYSHPFVSMFPFMDSCSVCPHTLRMILASLASWRFVLSYLCVSVAQLALDFPRPHSQRTHSAPGFCCAGSRTT